MTKDDKLYTLALVVCGFGILLCLLALGLEIDNLGYKRGQLNYAQGTVVYTVIDGQVIHIEGKAPERPISPKDIERGSK